MTWTVTTPPSAEPITLADAKSHLRVTQSNDDTLIALWLTTAREHVENVTERALMPQKWTEKLDAFPTATGTLDAGLNVSASGEVALNMYGVYRLSQPIELRGGRVTAVESITYTDESGVDQTLAPSAYQLDTSSEPARIVPNPGQSWPNTLAGVPNAVRIVYDVGYADAASVPASLRAAVLLILADLYENRQSSVIEAGRTTVVENPTVFRLLWPYRRVRP